MLDYKKPKKKARSLEDIHAEALRRLDRVYQAQKDVRDDAAFNKRFATIPTAQWGDIFKELYQDRPMMESNHMRVDCLRLIQEYRKNRISVLFRPKDGSTGKGDADILNGLYRADEQDSGGRSAFENAFDCLIYSGFGAVRLSTVYEDDEDADNERQRILIEPIHDPENTLFIDDTDLTPDKRNAGWGLVLRPINKAEYEETYGVVVSDVQRPVSDVGGFDWVTAELVYIGEYFIREQVSEEYRIFAPTISLEDGGGKEERYAESEFDDDGELERDLSARGMREARRRTVKTWRVRKYIIDGTRVIEDCGYIAGRHIPLVPAFANYLVLDGAERFYGYVADSVDLQRSRNMMLTLVAETCARNTESKLVFTTEQMQGHEYEWAEHEKNRLAYLTVNPVKDPAGNPVQAGPVAQVQPAQFPPALAAFAQIIESESQYLHGSPRDGEKVASNISGEAMLQMREAMDARAYTYMSDFARAVRRAGEVWLSMMQDIISDDEKRPMKWLGPRGETRTIEVRRPVVNDETGEVEYENDIAGAKMDAIVDVGPSYSSAREATVAKLTQVLQFTNDPEAAQIVLATIMRNIDGEGVSSLNEHFRKKLVQLGVEEPTPEERQALEQARQQGQQPTAQDLYLEAETQLSAARAEETKAKTAKTLADTEQSRAKTVEIIAGVDDGIREQAMQMAGALAEAAPEPMQAQQELPPGAMPVADGQPAGPEAAAMESNQ